MKTKIISLPKNHTISQFQEVILNIYGLPDDRIFSISDLLSNEERFTMRAIKGIRKGDINKLKDNLIIAFSWMAAIANRLHIDLEKNIWRRFPDICSYCGKKPCVCKKNKVIKRVKIVRQTSQKPLTLNDYQKMFDEIYPSKERRLSEAGVHFAEETGEVSEAIHAFLGEHKSKWFISLEDEIADWVSCMFGVTNSAGINISYALEKNYSHNCHVCKKAPCECNFSFIANFKS